MIAIIDNQALVWLGSLYAPLLPLFGAASDIATFYTKKLLSLHLYTPPNERFSASRTNVVVYSLMLGAHARLHAWSKTMARLAQFVSGHCCRKHDMWNNTHRNGQNSTSTCSMRRIRREGSMLEPRLPVTQGPVSTGGGPQRTFSPDIIEVPPTNPISSGMGISECGMGVHGENLLGPDSVGPM